MLERYAGRGAGGAVMQAQWRSGCTVAVKWVVTSAVDVPSAYMEALVAKMLAHPYLVQTFDYAMCQLDCSFSHAATASNSGQLPAAYPARSPTSYCTSALTPLAASCASSCVFGLAQSTGDELSVLEVLDSFEGPRTGSRCTGPVDSIDLLRQMGAAPGKFVVQIVSEWCDEGTLHAAIRRGVFRPHPTRSAVWPMRALLRTAREVALGMCHLHSLNIIHGDLKPGNVLLKSSRIDSRGFVAKVADFGLSRLCGAAQEFVPTSEWATVPYMAGEYLDNRLCRSSDVYSFGVLLWTMYTGKTPFAGYHEAHVAVGVMMGNLQLEWPADMPPPLLRLGQACCRHEPERRPTFKELAVSLAGLEVQARELHVRSKARAQDQQRHSQQRCSCSGGAAIHSQRLHTTSAGCMEAGLGLGDGGSGDLGEPDAAAHTAAPRQLRAASCSAGEPPGGRGLTLVLGGACGAGGGYGGALTCSGLAPLSPGTHGGQVLGRCGSSTANAAEAGAGAAAFGSLLPAAAASCPLLPAGSAPAPLDVQWWRVGEGPAAPAAGAVRQPLWTSPFASCAVAPAAASGDGVAARPRLELPGSPRGCRRTPTAEGAGLEAQLSPGGPPSSCASTATCAATATTVPSSRQLSFATSHESPAVAAAARTWCVAAATSAAGAGSGAGAEPPQWAPLPAGDPEADGGSGGGVGCWQGPLGGDTPWQHLPPMSKPSVPEHWAAGSGGGSRGGDGPGMSAAPTGAGAGGSSGGGFRVLDASLLLQQQHPRRLPRPPLGQGQAGHSARVLAGYAAAVVMPGGSGRRGSAGSVLQHVPEDEGDGGSSSSVAGLAVNALL